MEKKLEDYGLEDIQMLERENKEMAEALEKLGYTDDQISNICNGYNITNKKININFSEEDLQDLINGETFDWTFDGIDVHLYKCEDNDDN